jgi:molybdopterin-binding protein
MASFVGMKNIIPVQYRNGAAFTEGGMQIVLKGEAREGRGHIAVSPDSIVVSIGDTRGITSERNRQTGIVKNITRDGYGFIIGIECSDTELFAAVTPASLELLKLREGMAVHISFKASAVHVF